LSRLKSVGALVFAIFFLPQVVCGQSVLTFARVINLGEMQSVGFAVVNPRDSEAEVTFELFDSTGVATRVAAFIVPARGQLARFASEIFSESEGGGWVRASSPVAGIRGFWISGDFQNFADGAESASVLPDLVLPLVTEQSEISLVNPALVDSVVLIRLFGVNGLELAEPVVRLLPSLGSLRVPIRSLFDLVDWTAVTHARITASSPLAAGVMVANFQVTPALAAINGTGAATTSTLVFPHVLSGISGTSDYSTTVGVLNTGVPPQDVSLSYFLADGSLVRTVRRTIAGNGILRGTVRSVFSLDNSFTSGWITVSGSQSLIGFSGIADLAQRAAVVTAGLPRTETSFLFGHMAQATPWLTGISLVNPGTNPVTVDVFAIAADGVLLGGPPGVPTARFVMLPGEKSARLLSEWIPALQSVSSNGGSVFIQASAPMHGQAFVFTRDSRLIGNLPPLGSGAGLTPLDTNQQ
jgi:hypothetical protein